MPDMYGRNLILKSKALMIFYYKEMLKFIAEGKFDTEPRITLTYPFVGGNDRAKLIDIQILEDNLNFVDRRSKFSFRQFSVD